jgi:hypothetical protein
LSHKFPLELQSIHQVYAQCPDCGLPCEIMTPAQGLQDTLALQICDHALARLNAGEGLPVQVSIRRVYHEYELL